MLLQVDSSAMRRINPKSKEIFYNPTVEELYAPQVRMIRMFDTVFSRGQPKHAL
jgi:hypothetical protein